MKSSKKWRKWTGPALYALFLVVVVEVALRVYLVHFAGAGNFETYASKRMLENRFEEPQLIPHIYLNHTNNTKYDRSSNKHNNLGFRGEEISLKKPMGSFRIVCIGGSTTYGTGVEDYKQSYPYLLQEALQQAGINAEVINAGVEGYNSLQSYLNYLLKLEALEPDMLIIYQAINDVWTRMVWPPKAYLADQSGAYLPAKDDPYHFLRRLSIVRVSLVYAGLIAPDNALTNMVHVPETNYFYEFRTQLKDKTYPSGVFETVPLDSMISTNRPVFFRENIDRLIREANSKGTQVVLSTFIYSTQFPEFYPEMATPGFQLAIDEHNQVLRDLGMKHDVSLIDLANELEAKKELFTDGMHFNFAGNQKRVEILKDFLVPVIEQALTREADH